MKPAVPLHQTSRAAVLEVGVRLTEAPSRRLIDIAFGRELQAQQLRQPQQHQHQQMCHLCQRMSRKC